MNMEVVFLKVANMSINATWLIAAVVLLRFLLKKAPKQLRCVLWGLVALRLILPFSIESVFSILPSHQTLPDNILYTAQPIIDSGIPFVDEAVNPILSGSMTPHPAASANPTQIWSFVFSQLWILGMVLMAGYALFSWLHVRKKVSASISVSKDVRLCDYIDSPFILGLFRPVIYLPSALSSEDAAYVMAHERSHLKRRDHWWKPLGFAILAVHWFNPLVWVAYVLLCRDIELACDEKVIRDLGEAEKKAYSGALLNCSIRRPNIAACPLAFGEVGVKQRIKSVLHYKKPTFWILAVSAVACTIAAVCFFTDPPTGEHTIDGTTIVYKTDKDGRITFITHEEEDSVYTVECKEKYPTGAVERPYRLFPNGEIRDAAGNLLHIQYITVTGLRRETAPRLIDHYQYDPRTETFTLSPGSDSLDQLTLCSFPDIPQDNNLAALAGFGEEEICTIALSSRIGIISLSSEEEMTAFAEFLSGFAYDPIPLSEKDFSETDYGGYVSGIAPTNRNSHYLEEKLFFSEDYSTVFLCFDEDRSVAYRVLNPEGLDEYFFRRTSPARNESVTAAPFATSEEPGKWLRGIHAGAVEKVVVYYAPDSHSIIGGTMTMEALESLLPVLNSLPESALSYSKQLSDFDDAYRRNTVSVVFYDRANGIAVNVHWNGESAQIITCGDVEKAISFYKCPDASVWDVDSHELAALRQSYSQDDPTVSLLASRDDYVKRYPGIYSIGNKLGAEGITLTLPESWILDSYSEGGDENSDILFRLWPEQEGSGSITFQFWLKDTFACCGLGSSTEAVTVGKYPATAIYYDGSDQWTYLQIPGKTCDLVIVNEAGHWFWEYEAEILSILATLDAPECFESES